MIDFNFNIFFELGNRTKLSEWIISVIHQLGFSAGTVMYHFVSDEELYDLNVEFLSHDTLTDIISFDYSDGKLISGEIFISVDRVSENADTFQTNFKEEIHLVMIHGILHFCGIKDETEEEKSIMRSKEEWALKLLKEM